MAEFSEHDAHSAEQIVEQLMSDGERSVELENDIVIYDLELDTAQFSNELQILEDFGANVPAIRVDEEQSVPVSFRTIFSDQVFPEYPIRNFRSRGRWWRNNPFVYESLYSRIRDIEQGEEFYTISPTEARMTFRRLAIGFLATRIAFVKSFRERGFGENWNQPTLLNLRQKATGRQVATPGCSFNVSTNSNGLRVFWSGAYYVSPNYFSHPTSPATSVLQSGTYLFGVDGGAYGNTIQWDASAVVSLPGNPYIHLNY